MSEAIKKKPIYKYEKKKIGYRIQISDKLLDGREVKYLEIPLSVPVALIGIRKWIKYAVIDENFENPVQLTRREISDWIDENYGHLQGVRKK